MRDALKIMALTAAAISLARPLEEAGYHRVNPWYPSTRKGHSGVARAKRQAAKARRR